MTTTVTNSVASKDDIEAEEPSATFSKWREFNINDDDDGNDNGNGNGNGDKDAVNDGKNNNGSSSDDNEEDTAGLFRMFDTEEDEDVYEDVRYEYPTIGISAATETCDTSSSSSSTAVTIRHHGAYPHSTGLAVWRGAEILARFLCDQQQQQQQHEYLESTEEKEQPVVNLRNKKVMEVGAGAGLPGIVSHKVLEAASVLVTDGDFDALNNLKYNVDRNRKEVDAGHDAATSPGTSNTTISCLQLIWGKGTDNFLRRHGKQDVILAADCVYMVPSLKPLWETIDTLLNDNGVFIYAQTAASAVPWKDFKERIEYHNFENILSVVGNDVKKYDNDNGNGNDNGNDDNKNDDVDGESPPSSSKKAEEYEQGIYVFRRRQ